MEKYFVEIILKILSFFFQNRAHDVIVSDAM